MRTRMLLAALLLLLPLPLFASVAPPARNHGGQGGTANGTELGTCTRRFTGNAGPDGTFIDGPASVTRHYTSLGDLTEADSFEIERCWSDVWSAQAENVGTLSSGSFAYWNQRVRLDVFINGLHIYQETLAPTPPIMGTLDPLASTFVYGDEVATGGVAFFPMTDPIRAALSDPMGFFVTVVSSGTSNEYVDGGIHGRVDFFWEGGLNVHAIDTDMPSP